MGSTAFNTLNCDIVQLLGTDGATPVAPNNPLPISQSIGTSLLTKGVVNIASSGTSTLVASATAAIKAYKLLLSVSTATNLTFLNGTTALTGAMSFGANGSLVLDNDGEPWFSTSASSTLSILSSVTSQISGAIYYTST